MNFLLGQIVPFAGNFAPQNWMQCDGRLLPISQYSALFSLLGTYYGGNGTSNFALPDLRGATAVSVGQAPGGSQYDLGQTGGTESNTIGIQQMPMHTHAVNAAVTINVNDNRADQNAPGVIAQNSDTTIYTTDPDGSTKMAADATTVAVTIGTTGAGTPVPTLSPFLTVTYCICVNGIFPQRP